MASLTSGDTIDWLWGSLKPWQILHSTLAERERCGNVLDVWELVNEALSASTTRVQEGDGGRSHGLHFFGDIIDGDFWRHGGVMETQVKECLTARINGDDHEDRDLALQLISAADHHNLHHHPIDKCSTEFAIACSTHELPCAPRSIAWQSAAVVTAHDLDHFSVNEESGEEHEEADNQGLLDGALHAAAAAEEEEEGIHSCTEEELEEEEEEDDTPSSPYTQTIRSAIYSSMISANGQDNADYREISRDCASVFIINPCCSAVAATASSDQAASTVCVDGADQLEGRLGVAQELEENIEVCAVCLEKLTHYHEEGVQALTSCRHAFHRVCIAPWLQRQPQACCPCCRAPIFPDSLGPPLHIVQPAPAAHVAAAHHLHDRYANCGDEVEGHASNDIMGLLADMEAALERLGFRS